MTEKPEKLPDDALIALAQSGDRDGYSQLVRRHQAHLHALVGRYIGSRDDVADIVQDALVQAYTHLHTFDNTRPFVPWIRTIAKNLVANHLRSRATDGKYHQKLVSEALAGTLARHGLVPTADRGREMRVAALRRCIAKITGTRRKIFELRYHAERGVNDIAEEVSKTPTAVSMILMRMRQSLKTCVDQQLAQDGQS